MKCEVADPLRSVDMGGVREFAWSMYISNIRKELNMAKNTIRIRLKAYEHRILDDSAKKIVETVTKHGAKKVVGPVP